MQKKAAMDRAAGRHVLIIEDQFLLSRQIAQELRARGFATVGPGANLTESESLAREAEVDGAVVYSWSRNEMIFSSVRALMARQVPFVYVSAEDGHHPDWLPDVPSFGGEASMDDLMDQITRMLKAPGREAATM
jgi:hypothetical protein